MNDQHGKEIPMAQDERVLSGFEKRWLRLFAGKVPKEEIEKRVIASGNYIWHVFSWDLLPEGSFMEGDPARDAFDKVDKTGARYYKPFAPPGAPSPKYRSPSAADLDMLTEIYVIAADRSWTYIKTHEGNCCGPYFCRRKDV